MPQLTWPSKAPPQPIPAQLEEDSIVFPTGAGYPQAGAESRLILGDNLAVMSALIPEWEGRIPLIYVDPPFFTNKHYPARVGRGEDSRKPAQWQLAEGYPDHWPNLDAYLDMLYPRLALMHRLLSPTGTLYLHLDWHASAYARLLLDEIFGPERFLNEIVWIYHGPSPIRSAFNRKHDTLLVYTKSEDYTFNVDAVRQPYDPSTVKTFASSPKAGFGKKPNLARGKVPEDWWYFPVVARLHRERTGYPTQKPEALLERILLASSNPGDLVADFFSGSGTTASVAARLGRRFLASDGSWRAIHTARSRLQQTSSTPFAIQNVTGAPFPRTLVPANDQVTRSGDCIHLASRLADSIDAWEIDPAWDGSVFRSAAQAFRPRTQEPIRDHLTIPPAPAGGRLCLRWIDLDGKHSQMLLP